LFGSGLPVVVAVLVTNETVEESTSVGTLVLSRVYILLVLLIPSIVENTCRLCSVESSLNVERKNVDCTWDGDQAGIVTTLVDSICAIYIQCDHIIHACYIAVIVLLFCPEQDDMSMYMWFSS
jgi:hypothetical protein